MRSHHVALMIMLAAGGGSATAQAAVVAPVELSPGQTITSLPNGYSSGDGISEFTPYDQSQSYTFSDGLSLTLRARVISYADAPSAIHPGLYFDYEIKVQSGSIDAFSVGGWSSTSTDVKICGIAGCGGSGANGVAPTSVSRSINGSELTWNFDGLMADEHSANLQVFSSATDFVDPLASFKDASGNTFSVDTVGPLPTVPLPASASLFGGALLALGVVGYGLKRKMVAAT
jgi:hypothetical protein